MSVLLAAVEGGSLSKASRNLRLPLATVSRKVSELETHLNATLLVRSAKGLELTPAGRSYVTAAKSILEQLNEAERAASGEYTEPKGDLVVTAPIMFGRLNVLPVVTRFLEAFPDVSVGLVMTDRVTHFLEDQVDVAVRSAILPTAVSSRRAWAPSVTSSVRAPTTWPSRARRRRRKISHGTASFRSRACRSRAHGSSKPTAPRSPRRSDPA